MQVFCDGAFSKKPLAAGVGATFSYQGEQFDLSRRVEPDDSNKVELRALTYSLQFVLEVLGESVAKTLDVSLHSDSDYVEREKELQTNSWKKVEELFSHFSSVSLTIVKSHRGAKNHVSLMNEHVDRLAKSAMRAE